MKSTYLWLVILGTLLSVSAQERTRKGEFTTSPTEHIINELDRPFTVRSVRGLVVRREGFREPLGSVLIEIQGPDGDTTIRSCTTDSRGKFKISHVPQGKYAFKVTLNGFQSVMGTIVVSGRARKSEIITVEMPVGV